MLQVTVSTGRLPHSGLVASHLAALLAKQGLPGGLRVVLLGQTVINLLGLSLSGDWSRPIGFPFV